MSKTFSKRNQGPGIFSIPDSNLLLYIFSCLAVIVIISILIGNYAFKNGLLTCDHYVFNTYLYIILAFMLMMLVILLNDKTGFFNSILMWMGSGSFIRSLIILFIMIGILFALTYLLVTIDPKNILASHTVWLTLVLFFGMLLIPIVWVGRIVGVVAQAVLITIGITIIIGLLGYYYGNKIVTFDWDRYLRYALFAVIIVSIIGPFLISKPEDWITFIYVISAAMLVIFILLLLSNHKKLKENADKCIDGQVTPNYPLESWQLVIKIYQIFRSTLNILAARKLSSGRKFKLR